MSSFYVLITNGWTGCKVTCKVKWALPWLFLDAYNKQPVFDLRKGIWMGFERIIQRMWHVIDLWVFGGPSCLHSVPTMSTHVNAWHGNHQNTNAKSKIKALQQSMWNIFWYCGCSWLMLAYPPTRMNLLLANVAKYCLGWVTPANSSRHLGSSVG